MNNEKYILAIDQGTSSSRAILFNDKAQIVKISQHNFRCLLPKDGYVEQKPQDIISTVFQSVQDILKEYKTSDIISCGITNQRETIIVWDKNNGKAVYNAIVWQDTRTDDWCKAHQKHYNAQLKAKTGLLLNPYFSASKIKWILDNVPQAASLLKQGRLLCGTVDSFLLWHLTKGKQHLTDATNASRTLLYNIKNGDWDQDLLDFFQIPRQILPQVRDCCSDFGTIDSDLFGKEIKINAMIGDQQSATVGQACFQKASGKITFGTGCFMMLNTGNQIVDSKSNLLSTVLYRLQGQTTYALEGSCFYAAAIINWLRDNLNLITDAGQTEEMAKKALDIENLYLVPAFNGLGAPYWNSAARGLISGLTTMVGKNEIVKAALESVILQSYDLIKAMKDDNVEFSTIRIDGGMVKNNWFNQRLATILQKQIQIPQNIESTICGAALFAGLGAGFFEFDELNKLYKVKETKVPQEMENRQQLIKGWHQAVKVACNIIS